MRLRSQARVRGPTSGYFARSSQSNHESPESAFFFFMSRPRRPRETDDFGDENGMLPGALISNLGEDGGRLFERVLNRGGALI